MPRTSNRGGAREGAIGTNYNNRTDLNQAKQAAPNQPYGQAGQQMASQSVVPLPNNQGQLAALAQNAQQVGNNQPQAAPAPQVYPGELGALTRPTDMPNQPVTHGSPLGPGAGPEALQMLPQNNSLAQTIATIAQQSGNPSIMALAQKAQQQNQPVNQAPQTNPLQPQVTPNGS